MHDPTWKAIRTRDRGGVAAPFSRRVLLQRAAAAGLVVGTSGLLAACGDSSESAKTTDAAQDLAEFSGGFTPSSGSTVPEATVKFAMWPYGDTTTGYIGIKRGYFADVGITLDPADGDSVLEKQSNALLLNEQLDISCAYAPNFVQTVARLPQLKEFLITDIYVGNGVLANPSLNATPIDGGKPFEEAVKATVEQMRGKRVALSSVGSNRQFFDTVLKLGGLTPKDIELEVLDDAKIVQLGKAGRIDFAFPAGAAQNLELVKAGWGRLANVDTLVKGLPQGDSRAVTLFGHVGMAATEDYIDANMETILRFSSVYWRIADDIKQDPKSALALALPYLREAAGVDIDVDDAAELFVPTNYYNVVTFEDQAQQLVDESSPTYYQSVYKAQITAAQDGGVIPKDADVTADDFLVAGPLYQIALDLKEQYEGLRDGKASSGDAALVKSAEEHYEHRNYLDAYRLIKAA